MLGHRLLILGKIAMQTALSKSPNNLPQNILRVDLEAPFYTASPKRIRRSPSYLYKKGNIFYFRYKFTAKEKDRFQHSEFRISLQTGFVHEAKRLARRLRSKLEGFIMDNQEHIDFIELKKKLAQELKKVMDLYPQKNPPSTTEIKNRMDLLRQKIIDSADSILYQPEKGYLIKNNQLTNTSVTETLDQSFFIKKLAVNDSKTLLSYHFPLTIVELLKEKIFTPDELTEENILLIINEFHKMQISLNRILYEREKGNYAYEKQFTVPTTATPHTVPVEPKKQEQPTGPTLFEALESYINEKQRMQSWTERTQKDFIKKLTFFCQQVTDIPVGSITKQHIREVKDIIDKLPAGYSSTYKKHTLEEIKAGAIPVKARAVPTTLNKFYGVINSFLIWLQTNYDEITVDLTKILKINAPSQTARQREIFNSGDLKKIFSSQEYQEKSFNADYKYWVPLIGYHTGMRLEEICQLYLSDIQQEDGIWFFNLTQNGDKHLKTAAAMRKVPIHPDLIEKYHFLDFVEQQKKQNCERLFPELKKQSGRYSHYASRWFGKYLKDIGVKTNNNFKDFHSFRHTFTHMCKLADVEEYKVKEVVGHETGTKNITYGHYGKQYGLVILYNDVIKKIPSLEG